MNARVRLIYGLVAAVLIVFGIRLFYVQVIKYGTYRNAALSDQLKEYQIPATRGIIEAHDGSGVVPIVLNQQLYTLFADPVNIKNEHVNIDKAAAKLQTIIGGDASQYVTLMKTPKSRYVVLAKQLTGDQNKKILALKYAGLGTTEQDYRTYPQGSLASQVLGFVDNNGKGQYGLEQALNTSLAGTSGMLKAITDANGVPLAATKGNIDKAPVNGSTVVTTIDLSMQAQMEKILADEYTKTKSKGISAIIMDPNTGQIKAMANYPTYDPSNYQNVTDPSLFANAAVSNAIEPGSIMKTLTTSAALNSNSITPDETFYDPAQWTVDGYKITDIEEDGGARQQSIASTLALSLNTGATWMLMQMSSPGQTSINQHGINTWHDYMTNHFRLGDATNIEQGYESAGYVPSDDPNQSALGLTYANTSFGQGVQVTALQMVSALSSVINGGTYYQPTLVDSTISASGKTTNNKPKVIEKNVVSPKTGQELIPLMEGVVKQYLNEGFSFMNFPSQYLVGGKTGTAQITDPKTGNYYDDKFNGTYMGFVGGDKPQYAIIVYNIQPDVSGYAGSEAGQPVFADLAHMLINNSFVSPKR